MKLDEIIRHFNNVKPNGKNGYMACCPYHGDKHQSLSISEKDGKILMNCFAGCDIRDILWSSGLQEKDLFNDPGSNEHTAERPRSVEYDYDRNLKKMRYYKQTEDGGWRKTFCWKHRDENGSWQNGMGGMTPPLYKQYLLDLARQKTKSPTQAEPDGDLFDDEPFNTVFIAEGEKDVDTLCNKLGLKAVCSPHGGTSGSLQSKWREEYNDEFRDLDVAILPDNDEVGRQFAAMVAQQIFPYAKSVKIVDLTREWEELPEKGDITDVYESEKSLPGKSVAETVTDKLTALTVVTPIYTKEQAEHDSRLLSEPAAKSGSTQSDPKDKPEWDTPIPFDDHMLPPFPVEALPETVRRFVLALGESIQVPMDLCASACLAALALAMQGDYRIRGKADWFEPLNLYVLNIARPSERKSSVLSAVIKPIYSFEAEYNERNAQAIQESHNELKVLEKKQEHFISELAGIESGKKKDCTEETALAVRQSLADITAQLLSFEVKRPKRLYADDITPEKLADVLNDNDGKISIMSSEAGIFDVLSGTYSSIPNLDVFLKAWSGDCIRVDRIGRASDSIMDPALTMLLMVQPTAICGILSNNRFLGRGLTARFLYCMPKSMVGHRRYRTDPVTEQIKSDYAELLFDVLDDENAEPRIIKLSDDADKLLEAFSEKLEPMIPKELPMVAEWMGKLVGTTLRIAGILCRAEAAEKKLHQFYADDNTENLIVSGETMKGAIDIGEYFLQHAQATFMLMGEDDVTDKSKYVLSKIRQADLREFNHKKILDVCRSFKKVSDIKPVLEHLTEYGWLKDVTPEYKGKGRRPEAKYIVNPRAFSADRPEIKNA